MRTFLSWTIKTVIVAIVFALFAGCGGAKVASNCLANDFVANGSDEEWTSPPQFYDKKRNVAIRVSNDDDSIYLCFSASNEDITRQLAMSGLTVWLDPEGGEKKRYGVRLGERKPPRHTPGMERDKIGEHERGVKDKPFRFEASDKIGILLPGDSAPIEMTVVEAEKLGVEFAGKCESARSIFEFKIRIYGRKSAFEMSPLEYLGIGFVAGMSRDAERPDRSGPPGRGPELSDGEPSGLGFGPDGGMGGGPPRGFGEKCPGGKKYRKPYEVWFKVRLAT